MGAYLLDLATLWAIFAMAATVVAALIEDAGFLHVGAASFLGVGAYTAALLSTRAGMDPQLALLATLPVGAALGAALHLAVGRLRGDVLALATLAVGVIAHGMMLNATELTGGPMGIAAIPARPPLAGHAALDAGIILGLVLALVGATRRSRFGLRARALRDDESLSDDLKLRPGRVRAVLWIASSAILALAGGVFAFHLRYIDPSSFTVRESVSILAMSLVLPTGRLVNASIGALFFIALPELLRFVGLPPSMGAEVRQLVFGVALVVVAARVGGRRFGAAIQQGGARA